MIGIDIIPPHVEFITPKHNANWDIQSTRIIEECGRVSHKSEGRIKDGSADPFIRKIAINYGHSSIMEHASFTACFVCSRSCSHQLVRHRLAAITQESQRYCDYSSDKKQRDSQHRLLQVIMPPSVTGGSPVLWGKQVCLSEKDELVLGDQSLRSFLLDYAKTNNLPAEWMENGYIWCGHQIRDYQAYLEARERGIPAEDARSHLTNACKTTVYVTYNWRMWRHVLGDPTCGRALNTHAQWEIKSLFLEALQWFEQNIPLMVDGLRTQYLEHKAVRGLEFEQDELESLKQKLGESFEKPEDDQPGIIGYWKLPIRCKGPTAT